MTSRCSRNEPRSFEENEEDSTRERRRTNLIYRQIEKKNKIERYKILTGKHFKRFTCVDRKSTLMTTSDNNIHDNEILPYALYIFGPKSGLTKKSGNLQ